MEYVKRISLAFLLFGVLLFFVGCSSNTDSASPTKDGNITTLEDILEKVFTGPNQELNELLEDPDNATIIGKEEGTKNPKHPTELDLYLEEMYQSYFTKDMYSKFLGEIALYYQQLFLTSSNIKTEVDSIDIKQNESARNSYEFIANVKFQKEGNEPKIYEVTGQANFTEEGKIAGFKISTDNGLSEALIED
jgi:hypothetical protein